MAQIKGTTSGFSVTLNYTLTSSDAYYTFTPSTIATVYNSSSVMCYGMALCTNKTNWENACNSFVEDGDGNIFYDSHEIWETRTEDVSYYGSVKIPRQTSASTVYLAIYMGYQNNWGITGVPGSTTPCAVVTINLPALASYAVTYDANGGTGSVASQTKYYGKSLTLQDNSFSKTDGMYTVNGSQVSKFYNFTKWNTKADGTGTDYAAKASYTANAAATMYAQWKRNPFISAFSLTRVDSSGNPDDMGGRIRCVAAWDTDPTLTGSTMVFSCGSASTTVSVSGSSGESTGVIDVSADPSQQYTVTATLTDSAGYTRAITATSTTEYTAPAITSFSVERVDDDGDLSDDGERIAYEVGWRVANIGSQTGPALLVLGVSDSEGVPVASVSITEFTPSASGNVATGTTSGIITVEGGFSTDSHYGVSATLWDDTERQANVFNTLPEAYFPFDILTGGHGAAFGKPAKTAELLDIGYGLNVDGDATVGAGPTLQVELSGICTIELRPDNTAYRNSSYIGTWLSERVIVLGGSGYRRVTVSESGDIVARFGVDTLATGTYAARGSVEVDGEPYSNVTVIITTTGYAIDANGNGRFSESVYAKGYKVNGEQAYPTFIRAGWSESSDESTLPVTPCFVLNPTNSAYYYCDGTAITRINDVNSISWPGTHNLTTTATANNQEWSIDMTPGSYTGTYWQVWSTKNGTVLACYHDDNRVEIPGGNLYMMKNHCVCTRRTDYSAAANPSSSMWMDSVVGQDSTGAGRFNLRQVAHADGYQGVQLEAHRVIGSTNYYNGIRMEINGSGTRHVVVSDAAAWRSGIGAAASSDRRLKSDIKPLGEDAVEFISKLEPVVYTINGERQVGLIAQDVNEADPWGTRMAFETQEGIDGLDDWEKMPDGSPTWKLDYIRIIAPLTAAVQKLTERVEQLEAEIAELKA